MKTKFSLTVVALTLCSVVLLAQGQGYTFRVLVSKGKAEVKNASAWQMLKVGATLKATDELRVSENSYLGLVHSNGRPLEVRDAGTYKVSELVARMGTGTSVMTKYTEFILSSNQEKKNRLTATGAVHRGFKDVIMIYLPSAERAELFGDKIALQWSSDEVKGPYEVIFSSLLEDELARFETTENKLVVDMTTDNLKSHYEVLVKVVSKENRDKGSKDYIIKKMRPNDKAKFAKSFNELNASLEEGSALSQYIMAGFFEENYLLNDALTAYQQAIQLAPDVVLYQEAYAEFLKRMGFDTK
jgi:hypothetical protein